MNEFFAYFFEIGNLFNAVFSVQLLLNGFYSKLGLLLLGIPLVMMVAFYLLWKYPYGKVWHWFLWLLIIGVLVSFFSYQILAAELAQFLYDPVKFPDCHGFVNNIVIVNGFYGLVIGFLYSLVFKQIPRPQSHLPFTLKRR